MFRNYLQTAWRFLKQNKIFAGINALGLSIALAASFIILLYVINELSYDHCHKNRKQVYKVLNYLIDFKTTQSGTPFILAKTLKEEFPQVEKSVNVRNVVGFKLKMGDEPVNVTGAIATDAEVFDIFTIPMIEGSKGHNLLADQNSIVLSRELAEKFFPGQMATGKVIAGTINNEEQVFTVTGVFEDIPVNSTLRAKCFVNSKWTIDPINKSFKINNAETSWNHDFWNTWILISDGIQVTTLEKQFRTLETKYISEKPYKNFSLQCLTDVYLHSENVANTGLQGSMKNIRLFSAIAFLIVLVAAVNYILLSTAVSTGRAKEIGIRKTNGANNFNIKNQLLSESVLLAVIVLPIAILFMVLALPYAGKLFQTRLQVIGSNMVIYALVYLALTLFIGIVSGMYTSAYLSGLKVVDILKNETNTGRRKMVFRSSLIVIQLVIFCSFVSGTLIVRSQYQYALKRDPGHFNNNILMVDLGRDFKGYAAYINNIKSNPNVISAAGTMEGVPMSSTMTFMVPHYQDKTQQLKVEGLAVDFNFMKTMGIPVISGREFSEDFGSDLKQSCILNETAVKLLGITDPVGKQCAGKNIIGVVKNFNLHSIRTDIPPIMITMTDRYINQVAVNYKPGALGSLLPMLEAEWKKDAPDRPFRYSTIEEIIEELYSSEKNLSMIVSIFALFTLLIAAFGLFGLTLFTVQARTKEIGIKKVFGSSGKAIVYSFLKGNVLLVLVAALLTVPVTLYFMRRWLEGFAYQTPISAWAFLVAFAIATVVVLLTVLFHSFRASRINPVEALRYE
jgi:putative ABC transport system permease protein